MWMVERSESALSFPMNPICLGKWWSPSCINPNRLSFMKSYPPSFDSLTPFRKAFEYLLSVECRSMKTCWFQIFPLWTRLCCRSFKMLPTSTIVLHTSLRSQSSFSLFSPYCLRHPFAKENRSVVCSIIDFLSHLEGILSAQPMCQEIFLLMKQFYQYSFLCLFFLLGW